MLLNARYTEVEKNARPTETTMVASIKIGDAFDGSGLTIQGRPEDLVRLGREILAAAEEIVVETMRDPELRALYGITTPTPEPSSSVAGINTLGLRR